MIGISDFLIDCVCKMMQPWQPFCSLLHLLYQRSDRILEDITSFFSIVVIRKP